VKGRLIRAQTTKSKITSFKCRIPAEFLFTPLSSHRSVHSRFPPARVHEYAVGEISTRIITDSNNIRRAHDHTFTLPLSSCSRSSLHNVLFTVAFHRREFMGTQWEKGAFFEYRCKVYRGEHEGATLWFRGEGDCHVIGGRLG